MSKQTFSEKINKKMKTKIEAVEHINLEELLKKDEDFEFILSLTYLVLSKEKIIKKEIKNKDRLGRLTKLVDQKEIDKVFDPNFSKEIPNIINTLEINKMWILDNIRDSIMHGSFEIDEEKKLVLIDNQGHDRNLKTEIPFSWFIEYAKNDILKKRNVNEHTVYGFYYNKDKLYKKQWETQKELKNNIVYFFKISGTTFNINKIENRIKELYKEYSNEEYDETLSVNYKQEIEKYKKMYNEKYLLSFYLSSEKVKKVLEKEYPNIQIQFGIKYKNEIIKKIIKKCSKHYINYDLMIEDFNNKVSKKGINLLNYLENIITKQAEYENTDFSNLNLNEKFNIINNLVSNQEKQEKIDIKQLYYKNENILKSLFLNIYGIATLVTNQQNIYNTHYINEKPEDYCIFAADKNTYKELMEIKRKLGISILECDIKISQIEDQYNNCKEENKKKLLEQKITDLNKSKQELKQKHYEISQELDYRIVIKGTENDKKRMEKLLIGIENLYTHFYKTTSKDNRMKIKKAINKLAEKYIEETSKYTFGKCRTMNDTITIIRNCFSHIGRTTVGEEKMDKHLHLHRYIYLTDYDNDNEISGIIKCEYEDLLKILNSPYEKQKILEIKK